MEKVSLNLAETTIKMLGDRWKVQIIESLMDGTKRFGELKKELQQAKYGRPTCVCLKKTASSSAMFMRRYRRASITP